MVQGGGDKRVGGIGVVFKHTHVNIWTSGVRSRMLAFKIAIATCFAEE